jgi:hypothetical protein
MKDHHATVISTKNAPIADRTLIKALSDGGLIFVSSQLPIKSDGAGLQDEARLPKDEKDLCDALTGPSTNVIV